MYHFNSKKIIYFKGMFMTGILLVLGFGLYFFNINQEFLQSFQLYHLKTYAATFNYKIDYLVNRESGLAMVSQSVNKNVLLSSSEEEVFAKSIPVLLYHGIVNKPDGSNVSVENFNNQMFALKKAGYETITLEDFWLFVNNKKQIPAKSFLLTFDDGRKDSYYPVDPILKSLNYNAVMFVITDKLLSENNYYLSKKELKTMVKSGRWELQSHTMEGHKMIDISFDGKKGHFLSNKMWIVNEQRLENSDEFKERISKDLVLAKNKLEKEFNIKVYSFAYPYGDYGQKTLNYSEAEAVVTSVARSLYPLTFYQISYNDGFIENNPNKNNFLFKRINVETEWLPQNLLSVLEASRPKKTSPESNNNVNKDEKLISDFLTEEVKQENQLIRDNVFEPLGSEFFSASELKKDETPVVLLDSLETNFQYIIDNFNEVGLRGIWGDYYIDKNNYLNLSSSTPSSFVVFKNSSKLKNYLFKIKSDWGNNSGLSLVARYKDLNNYVYCSFSQYGRYVSLFTVVDGKIEKEGKTGALPISSFQPYYDIDLAIQVRDSEVKCFVNEQWVLKGDFDKIPTSGGIGVKKWNNGSSDNQITVKRIKIEFIK